MATKNTILGTVPKSRGRYTEGDTTTKWYYDNILEYKGSSFRCISEESTGITGAPATYNSGTHTLVPNTGWEFFVDTTGALDVEERLAENEEKLSELETEVIYDVTANNNGMTFASLSTLLLSDNLSTLIPVSVRCGGMNIRFIQTSDNKYVQYRLMAQNFSTTKSYWQGVDDATFNLAEEQKSALYQTLAENRSMARITDEEYEQIQKVIELVRVGFVRQFKEYMDLMTEKSEYATAEWEFKRGDMLTQALKKTHFQWEMEELNDSYEHFKNVYQSAQALPSAGQCAKYIDELTISEDEAIKTIKELLLPMLSNRSKE